MEKWIDTILIKISRGLSIIIIWKITFFLDIKKDSVRSFIPHYV